MSHDFTNDPAAYLREQREAERLATEQAAAKQRALQAKINAAIPEMVVIPAGTFTMGCVSVWSGC